MSYILRDYQRVAHDAFFYELGIARRFRDHLKAAPEELARFCPLGVPTTGKPVRSTLLDLGTSAGKTVIMGAIFETLATDPGFRMLLCADTDELCAQPLEKFRRMGLIASVEKADLRASLESQIVVASLQTLARPQRRGRFPASHFDLVVFDEAHRQSHLAKATADFLKPEYRAGLTGTAFRTGEEDLSKFYDTVCFKYGFAELQAAAYTVPLRVLTVPITVDISNVHTRAGDYVDEELDSAIVPHYEKIVEALMQHSGTMSIVTFTTLVKSAELFAQICRHHGLTSEHVSGASEDRRDILRRYEAGEFRNIACSSLLSTGWDCPIAACMCNLRPTQSTSLFRQEVGRILRVLPGTIDGVEDEHERRRCIAASAKPHSLLLDFLWETKRHGLSGPAMLMDAREDVLGHMNRKARAARAPEDFLAMARAAQSSAEERLRKRLDWASRQSQGLFDGTALPIMAGNHALAEYTPFGREAAPLKPFTRHVLEREQIDPDTVPNEGYARRLLRQLGQRKWAGQQPIQRLLRLTFEGAEKALQQDAADLAARLAERR